MLELKRTNNLDKDFLLLVSRLDADLAARYGQLQQVYDQYNKIENLETVVVAYDKNVAVGCGCFKQLEDDVVEVKRMYVDEDHRGKGIGACILTELENWAGELRYSALVLETGNNQPEAVRLYQKKGYQPISNYGQYAGMDTSICMKKALSW